MWAETPGNCNVFVKERVAAGVVPRKNGPLSEGGEGEQKEQWASDPNQRAVIATSAARGSVPFPAMIRVPPSGVRRREH